MMSCSKSALSAPLWTLVGLLTLASMVGCGDGSTTKRKAKKSAAPKATVKKALDEGQKHLANGNRKKAIAAYTRAIKLDSKCKQAFVWRGVAYNESGQSKKALADFTKAIKLDPTDSYAYEQRASIYEKSNNRKKAAADRKKAAALRGKRWEELPDNMAKLKKKLGRK